MGMLRPMRFVVKARRALMSSGNLGAVFEGCGSTRPFPLIQPTRLLKSGDRWFQKLS